MSVVALGVACLFDESEAVVFGSNRAESPKGLGTGVSENRTTSVPHPLNTMAKPHEAVRFRNSLDLTASLPV